MSREAAGYPNDPGLEYSLSQTYTNVSHVEVSATAFFNPTNPFQARELVMTVTTVPEPSATALLGLGGLTLILRRNK